MGSAIALLVVPDVGLPMLWDVAVALIPATLLISPLIWRNVCPLATLNMFGNRLREGRRATPVWTARANLLGILLFAALVPARRFLFNESGAALALTIGLVAAAAVVLGVAFDGRAGFCNALCPVLPVERLYGQNPMVGLQRARCSTCSACGKGCPDLIPDYGVRVAARTETRGVEWLRNPFALFAAALPGFVLGYFAQPNTDLLGAGQVYARVFAFAGGSVAIVALAAAVLRLRARVALPVLAALAVALYYWHAAPGLAGAFGAAEQATLILRVATLGLVAWWGVRAIRSARPAPRRAGPCM